MYKTVTETSGAPGYGVSSVDTVTSWRTTTVTAPGESSNQTLTSTVVSTEKDKTTEKTTETAYQNSTVT